MKQFPSPRIVATHLHYDLLPKSIFKNKAKVSGIRSASLICQETFAEVTHNCKAINSSWEPCGHCEMFLVLDIGNKTRREV